jgi:23S rRNA pseudouridine2605 synthase
MTEKLQKVLARSGLGSRREVEHWIQAGRVAVNGKVASLGERISHSAEIYVDGREIKIQHKHGSLGQPIVLAYHKPEGEVCTRKDPENRPTVFDQLPSLIAGRWVMVGRLDFNTSGLLLFTNDGDLAHQLMHPSFHFSRVYAVRVFGEVSTGILAKLKSGIALEDGMAHFDKIIKMGGGNSNKSSGRRLNHWYEVTIASGRNRIIRRLWESQGLKVSRLIRLSFGPITLPNSLDPGGFVALTPEKVVLLQDNRQH